MFFGKKLEYSNEQEAELVQKARTGDQNSFGQLYELYVEAIYKFCFIKTSDHTLAEDLTQTTFVKVLDNFSQFKNGSFKAWLFSIARNTVIDHYRKASTQKETIKVIQDSPSKENILQTLETKDDADRLQYIITNLPSPYSEVLILRFINDLTIAETAQTLRKDEGWVRVTTHRALKMVREQVT
jgi:RNA polymerase sigma-70 factor (ECF subfamily)